MTTVYGIATVARSGEMDCYVMERDPSDHMLGWVYWEAYWDLDMAYSLVGIRFDEDSHRILIGKAYVMNQELGGDLIATSDLMYLHDRMGVGREDSVFEDALRTVFGQEYVVGWDTQPSRIPDIDGIDVDAWYERCASFVEKELQTAPKNGLAGVVIMTSLPPIRRKIAL